MRVHPNSPTGQAEIQNMYSPICLLTVPSSGQMANFLSIGSFRGGGAEGRNVFQINSLLSRSLNQNEQKPNQKGWSMNVSLPSGWINKLATVYVELQDQWNGPYFFLKKSYLSPPVNETAPIFF